MADLKVVISALNQASGELRKVAGDLNKLDQAAQKSGGGAVKSATSFTKLNSVLSATGLQSTALGGQLNQLSAGMGSIGIAAGSAAVGIGALAFGLGGSIKAAVDFQSAFADVRKTVDASDAEFDKLSRGIRDMAKELPIAVTQLTDIAAIAGQLGITGTNNIERFTRVVAQLGISTGLSSEEIASSLGTLAAVMNFPIGQIDRLGSGLTALGNNFNSTEGQILEFATRFAGVAHTVGLSSAEVLGISNAFASVGVEAERGGTAIQKVLLEMQQATVNADDSLQLFAATAGLTADQFQRLFKSDPAEVFIRFIEGLAQAGDKAVPILDALGVADARIVASFLQIASAGPLARDSINEVTKAALINTATQDEVAKRTNTTSAQFQLLKNNVNDVAIGVGNDLNPALYASITALNFSIDTIENTTAGLVALDYVLNQASFGLYGFVKDWRHGWDQIASTTELTVNGILEAIEALTDEIDDLIGGINSFTSNKFTKKGLDLLGLGDVGEIPKIGFDAPDISIPRASGGGGGSAGSFGSVIGGTIGDILDFQKKIDALGASAGNTGIDIDAITKMLDDLFGPGGGGGGARTALDALSDGVIDLGEALKTGLSDAQIVTLELAAAQTDGAAAAFRNRIELLKLAAVFPGLTGAEVQFRLGLAAIAEELKESGRTAEQFDLAERIRPALDAVRSQFDAIFGRPTRETAQLELQLATLERDRLLRKQAGASDSQLTKLDAEIDKVRLQLDIRRAEIDIIRKKNTLADRTLLTDAAQAVQAQLTTMSLAALSAQADATGGIVYLQLTNLGNAANEAAAALRGVAPQGFASGGIARGLALVGEHGPELADFGRGSRIYSNRDTVGLLSAGTPAPTYTINTYVTADSEASDRAMHKLARIVVAEQEQAMRRRGLAGANVSMNAFPPRNR